LLKFDKEQLTNLSEIILFITSISSKKDYYIDKIGELEDIRIVNTFFTHIEKYIYLDNKFDETNNLNQSHLDRSYLVNQQNMRIKEEYEKEKENLLKVLRENEKELSKKKEKFEILEKNYQDLEMRYKDKEREVEMSKNSHSQNVKNAGRNV